MNRQPHLRVIATAAFWNCWLVFFFFLFFLPLLFFSRLSVFSSHTLDFRTTPEVYISLLSSFFFSFSLSPRLQWHKKAIQRVEEGGRHVDSHVSLGERGLRGLDRPSPRQQPAALPTQTWTEERGEEGATRSTAIPLASHCCSRRSKNGKKERTMTSAPKSL